MRRSGRFLYKLLLAQSPIPKILVVRYMLAVTTACVVSFLVLYAGLKADIRFMFAAPFGLLCGLLAGALIAVCLVTPKGVARYTKGHRHAFIAAMLSAAFVAIGVVYTLGGVHLNRTQGTALTFDEISILANGYYPQTTGTYFTNPEHPPLVKDIAALPFHVIGAQTPENLPRDVLLQDYAQYVWGGHFIFGAGNHAEEVIFVARLAVILANAALIFCIYLSIAKIWSRRAGLIAVFLMVFSQFVMAHGTIVTVDFMSAAFTVLALVWFAGWLKAFSAGERVRVPLVLAAVCLAGALLSKFSTILLPPVLLLLGVAFPAMAYKHLKGRWLAYWLRLASVFVLMLALIVGFYSWHVRDMAGTDIVSQLHTSYDVKRLPEAGLAVLEHAATDFGVLGRGFAEFAHGLLMVNNRIYKGAGGVYFMGHFYGTEGAGPLYFPLLYITKLQIVFHLLTIASFAGLAWLGWRKRFRGLSASIRDNPLPAVVVAYVVIFGGIACTSTLQIGLRHILPVIFGMMVLTALALDVLWSKAAGSKQYRRFIRPTAIISGILIVGSMLLSYPYYISYYNLLAGGTMNGYRLATDSNYDWGQDVKLLSKWQQDNQVDHLYVDLFINPFLPLDHYLTSRNERFDITKLSSMPSGSYIAISAHQYQLNTHIQPDATNYHQLDKYEVTRVGTSIFVYKLPDTPVR